eukprot:6947896-Pyramimonas_sp.AAC.1
MGSAASLVANLVPIQPPWERAAPPCSGATARPWHAARKALVSATFARRSRPWPSLRAAGAG